MNLFFQKQGIIHGILQTLNAKFKNKKWAPQFIAIKVLCFSTMYISSILVVHKHNNVFTNHLQYTDADDFHHGGSY